MKKRAPIRGKKLLKATLGVGVLTFAACAVFPGCNLLPPPRCDEEPNSIYCQDMATTDAARDAGTSDGGDAGKTDDAGLKDGGVDGGVDGAVDGGQDGGQTDGSKD